MDPTQSQRLQYTSSSTFRKPDKPSPATAVDFMYDSGKNHYGKKLFSYNLALFLGDQISAASFFFGQLQGHMHILSGGGVVAF